MTEKDKLIENVSKKANKSIDEIEKLVANKVNELSGLVSEEGAIYIIANELGIRLDSDRPKKEADFAKIEEITDPKTPVSLNCKVIRIYDRVTFSTSSGSEGSVRSLLVGDETAIIRIVFWNDKVELLENIQEEDIMKIMNAYTRENNNSERIEIHFGQYSDLEVNPKDVEIKLKEYIPTQVEFTDKKVTDLEEGDKNVKISGVIADFDIPRFYLGCPECFKKVFQDEEIYNCAQHGDVKALKIPIVNLVVDDGSSSVAVVGFRDRAENLTKAKTEEILSLAEDIDKYRSFTKKMVGSKVILGGNVSLSSMTGEKQLLANQVMSIEILDVEEIAEDLIEESELESTTDIKTKKDDKKELKKEKKSDELIDDDLNIDDIEEIDFDDDLM